MSQENVEIVRRAYEAFQAGFARGDPGAVFDSEAVADHAEWVPVPAFPGPSIYRGRHGFVEFMHIWTEDFEDFSFELDRLIDAGDDHVVALFHQRATGKGSGVPVELHMAAVCDVEDGRVIRMRNYLHPADALEAVGLRE